jgi:hypothetical protein
MLKFEPFKRYKDKVQLFTFRKRSIYHAQKDEKISGGNKLPVKTENQVKMYLKTLKKYKKTCIMLREKVMFNKHVGFQVL